MCPGSNESAGKRRSGKTTKGSVYLQAALVQAAWAASHTKQTSLAAQYRQLIKRMSKKALVAVGHSLLVIIYHVLKNRASYQELGGDYFDRDCERQFITDYTDQAHKPEVRSLVLPMTLNGSSIRDISRVLSMSTNTLLKVLRSTAHQVNESVVPKRIADLELDEFWSVVGKKRHQRWTWSAFDRHRKRTTASLNGRRTNKNCQRLLQKLTESRVRRFHTDRWESYLKLLPEKKHLIGKEGRRNIERHNLNFRTHIKRLQRRRICFSKSDEMHDAVIKLYIQHSNLGQHHI